MADLDRPETESIRRQDASGHMPLAVCRNGVVVDFVPGGLDTSDPDIRARLFAAAAAEFGSLDGLEILAVCHLHPRSSAVDCLDCEPIND